MGEKSLAEAYILGIPFGLFGAHHFYLGRTFFGILYACSLGLLGVGYIYDLTRMKWLVRHVNKNRNHADKKILSDCYLLGVVGGLFGVHHFYLGNTKLGIVYACTLGLFGFGWIGDLFRMKELLAASNKPIRSSKKLLMTKLTAYTLCMSPLGIFGVHHLYLKRYLNGGLFAATLGIFGFGWIFDMLRMRILYERYAINDKHKYLDDAYLFWFPFGLFGLHQFYLGRNKWGILYACTLGCCGVGWIMDGCRLHSLVDDYNRKPNVKNQEMVEFQICKSRSKVSKRAEIGIPINKGDRAEIGIPINKGDRNTNDLRGIGQRSGLNDDQDNASDFDASSEMYS